MAVADFAGLEMSDPEVSRMRPWWQGEQAFHAVVLGMLAVLGALSMRVLTQIDKTADKLESLQLQVSDMKGTFESRFNAHVDRLNSIDRRLESDGANIIDLQRRVWRMPAGNP